MLTATLILGSLLAAEPDPERDALLKTFREEFVAITPGQGKYPSQFQLGRAIGGSDSERPVQDVRFFGDFAIARYEVPQNLWEAVMGSNPSRWKGPRNSVEMLSFDEAEDFCWRATALMRSAKLIEPTQQIRLPSEAEWEYVARAGTQTVYSFGDEAEKLDDYGWFTGNASGNDPPVGAKKPNAWGLYDIHGYLWEWCSDPVHKTYQGRSEESGSWTQGGDARQRVLRGGSWKDPASKLTSSFRRFADRKLRDDAVGLRCVLADLAPFVGQHPSKILPEDSQLELLWSEGEFTEGPAAAPDGRILFSDIGNRIYQFDPATRKTTVFRGVSGKSNGLVFDRQGRLVACEGANGGNRRISITHSDGKVHTLADRFEGKAFNSPNDLAVHPEDGTIFFTDPRYVGEEPRELEQELVYAVHPETRAVHVATFEVSKPNGIVISPDGKHAYVAENNPQGARQLLKFRIDEQRKLVEKQVLFDFGVGRGIDGMTTDREGRVYATAGRGYLAGVYVFGPDGEQEAFIATPAAPTNCTFGRGNEARTLYITAGAPESVTPSRFALYRIRLAQPGFHLDAEQ